MKRMKAFFAVPLLLLAIPLWRYLDLLVWSWGSSAVYASALLALGLLCLVLPAWLLTSRHSTLITLALVLAATLGALGTSCLSTAPTSAPEQGHCGPLTYTGLLHPLLAHLPPSHGDDLEARNQLCWLRKMITEVPESFGDRPALDAFLQATHAKLLLPENKFRVALPQVLLLHALALNNFGSRSPEPVDGSFLVQALHFWSTQYTLEISARDYPAWDLPHGPYVKFEYGLFEKNWEALVNSIELEK